MVKFINGGIAKDERGQIRFVNSFNMGEVKRFYVIENSNINIIRGWRAHRIEQRWFYAIKGAFKISVVKIDNWEIPDRKLDIKEFIVDSVEDKLLHVPAGYGTAIKAITEGSNLLVFADYPLENSPLDNYTFHLDYFLKGNLS